MRERIKRTAGKGNAGLKTRLLLVVMAAFSMIVLQGWYAPEKADAAITYQGEGVVAYSSSGGATVTPDYPASVAQGELLVLIIGMKPSTANSGSVSTPAGWTPIVSITGAGGYGNTLGGDQGNTNLFTFFKVADGTESGSLTVDLSDNNIAWAQIYRMSKTLEAWLVAGATGQDTSGGNVSISFTSDPGVAVNDLILGAMCIPTDISTPNQFSNQNFTQSGVTFGARTEISEPDSFTGNDIGGFVVRAFATAGTSGGNPTMTATAGGTTTNVRGPGVFIRIRDANTPPVTSGLTFDDPVFGSFVGSPFSFHGDLTEDPGTTVTSCQVCVKNGSECTSADTWIAGLLSGSAPTWTCSAANVTTYSNGGAISTGQNVYIDVRGTSAGGTNTNGGTAIFRTMDKTAPSDLTLLSVTPGTDQNSLSWASPGTDAHSGFAGYDVRFLPGTTPPADCNSGTSAYTGTATSFVHTGLTPNQGGYSYRVCAVDNVNNKSAGRTGTGLPTWSAVTTSCGRCHAYPPADATGGRNVPAGAVVGDHRVGGHQVVCSTCHVAPATETSADYAHRSRNIEMSANIRGGSYSRGTRFLQTFNPTTGTCSNVSCHGSNNPTPQWGVGTAGCVDCHNGMISAPQASVASGGTVTRRDNVISEFGLAWGHKKTGRGAVTNSDCIVCHLEGNYSTQKPASAYHANGYIDLRDPDGAGETRVTNISAGAFSFVRFATSFAAGARTTTGHTSNNVDNVLTQKFCLACHDNNGATNTTARSTYGSPTQYMPFGGVNLGASYTVANGASAAGGLVNVFGQMDTANSSVHPVRGPITRDFPTSARMADPYKPASGRVNAGGTMRQSIVIYCSDCHNVPGASPLTNRTVAAHGNADTVRGVYAISGSPSSGTNESTFCKQCHLGYDTATSNGSHMSGSAGLDLDRNEKNPYMRYGCNICHSSGYDPVIARPVRALDIHGVNVLPGSGQTLSGRWSSAGTPIAFIRNRQYLGNHQPANVGGTNYQPNCDMAGDNYGPGGVCRNEGTKSYTIGGTY